MSPNHTIPTGIQLCLVVAIGGLVPLAWSADTIFAGEKVLRVGPSQKHKLPSEAAKAAKNGMVVEIEAGEYAGDAAVWRQNDLTIRGVGGRAHIKADGVSAEGKAIWVIKGNNARVENIEFSGAKVEDHNGAGIRFEGTGLSVSHCYFHDNQNGLLTGKNSESDIVIESSEFAYNGRGKGKTHNIYVGTVRSLTVRHSYLHHAKAGHNLKSRAHANYVLYNRIMDEADGTASYAIDLPDGRDAWVIGNLVQQGPETENYTLVNYASRLKGKENPGSLRLINNTLVNDRHSGVFVKHPDTKPILVINNIFVGPGNLVNGLADLEGNLVVRSLGIRESVQGVVTGGSQVYGGVNQSGENAVATDGRFVNLAGYDYRLTEGSPAVDVGIVPDPVEGLGAVPSSQYAHPVSGEPRKAVGPIDAGAYELQP